MSEGEVDKRTEHHKSALLIREEAFRVKAEEVILTGLRPKVVLLTSLVSCQ